MSTVLINTACKFCVWLTRRKRSQGRTAHGLKFPREGNDSIVTHLQSVTVGREKGWRPWYPACLPSSTQQLSQFEGYLSGDPTVNHKNWLLWSILCPWLREALALSYLWKGSTYLPWLCIMPLVPNWNTLGIGLKITATNNFLFAASAGNSKLGTWVGRRRQ